MAADSDSALVKPTDLRFDPDGAGDPSAGIFGVQVDPATANLVIVPIPWEATTSYGRGTVGGPQAVYEASPQLDLYDPQWARFGLADPWAWGIALLDADPAIAALNTAACEAALPVIAAASGASELSEADLAARLSRVDELSAQRTQWLAQHTREILDAGQIPAVLGGDHSVPLGAIAAVAERHERLGILHIDAHADLRVAYEGFQESHASIMDNVLRTCPSISAIAQVGIRDLSAREAQRMRDDPRLHGYLDLDVTRRRHEGEPWAQICQEIVACLPDDLWISFDIDGLDPKLCPHTGTPVPGGLSWPECTTLLEAVATSGKRVRGFDLCEVSPDPQGGDWNGNVGARVLYKLCGLSLLSAGAQDAPE